MSLETLMLDTRSTSQAMTTVLDAGRAYRLTVDGTYTVWDTNSFSGSPEADAMYPSHVRANTQVSHDADVSFAAKNPSGDPGPWPHHFDKFEIDLGGGAGWQHIEPVGGPFSAPESGHLYLFDIVGAGAAPRFRVNDAPLDDNYGDLKIVLDYRAVQGYWGIRG